MTAASSIPAVTALPPHRARSSSLRAFARLGALVAVTSGVYLLLLLSRALTWGRARHGVTLFWLRVWGRALTRICGIRYRLSGTFPSGPALLAPNHLGYADILVLSACQGSYFLSKTDVARWPLVGLLFRGTGHLTVDRGDPFALQDTVEEVTHRLQEQQKVTVFLEGTSSGGGRVLPFRPSLVQAAIESDAPVVPVAIRYRPRQQGVLVREDVAYWKDHVFFPHLWRFLGLRGVEAEVVVGEPLACGSRTRRQVAAAAEERVSSLLAA